MDNLIDPFTAKFKGMKISDYGPEEFLIESGRELALYRNPRNQSPSTHYSIRKNFFRLYNVTCSLLVDIRS